MAVACHECESSEVAGVAVLGLAVDFDIPVIPASDLPVDFVPVVCQERRVKTRRYRRGDIAVIGCLGYVIGYEDDGGRSADRRRGLSSRAQVTATRVVGAVARAVGGADRRSIGHVVDAVLVAPLLAVAGSLS